MQRTPQRLCVFDSTLGSADWIHDAVAGWRGPNLTETPDLVPFDQPQQGVLLQLQEAERERAGGYAVRRRVTGAEDTEKRRKWERRKSGNRRRTSSARSRVVMSSSFLPEETEREGISSLSHYWHILHSYNIVSPCYQADSSYLEIWEPWQPVTSPYFLPNPAYRSEPSPPVTAPHLPPLFLFWEPCGCYNGWQLWPVNPPWLSAVGAGQEFFKKSPRPDQRPWE